MSEGNKKEQRILQKREEILEGDVRAYFPSLLKSLYCTHISCWNCGKPLEVKQPVFCGGCKIVQHADKTANYFQVLGVEPKFDLSLAELSRKFKDLQRKLHPDKHARSEKELQEISAEYSSLVNQAFKTLNSPLERGIYLLEIAGQPFSEGDINISSDFLIEIMEINERLMDVSDEEDIREIGEKNRQIMNLLLRDISAAFNRKDYKSARESVGKMKFYANIADKVKSLEQSRGIVES